MYRTSCSQICKRYIEFLLYFQVDGVSGETLKFSEIVDWMKRVSFGWHDAGLEAGHVVCLVTPNCIQAPAAFLAAIAASAVVTLSNPLYTPGIFEFYPMLYLMNLMVLLSFKIFVS